jgi:phosphatidate phosphatase APP1
MSAVVHLKVNGLAINNAEIDLLRFEAPVAEVVGEALWAQHGYMISRQTSLTCPVASPQDKFGKRILWNYCDQ